MREGTIGNLPCVSAHLKTSSRTKFLAQLFPLKHRFINLSSRQAKQGTLEHGHLFLREKERALAPTGLLAISNTLLRASVYNRRILPRPTLQTARLPSRFVAATIISGVTPILQNNTPQKSGDISSRVAWFRPKSGHKYCGGGETYLPCSKRQRVSYAVQAVCW